MRKQVVKVFVISALFIWACISYSCKESHTHTALYGSMTINTVSPEITGAFYFTRSDSTRAGNGYFICKPQVILFIRRPILSTNMLPLL